MAIRITGMYSGLDTESIITQLASAQSVKKNKLVKEQMKLSWKQDAWKALNTKIYSFYTNVLDNMRFQGSYMKKATKVSNSDAVSVVTSSEAPNSVQSMRISQLAKQGYLTGGSVSKEDGGKVTASSKLADLGFTGEGKFRVKVGNKTTDITVDENMKISDVVKKFESAGLTASFDEKNQRFYFSSKNSGTAGNFTITGSDEAGMEALKTLGLVSAYDPDSAEYKEYELWNSYKTDAAARAKAEESEAAKRAAAKKASTDALLKKNEELTKKLQTLRDTNDKNDQYSETTTASDLYDQLYGPEHEVQKNDKDGNPVVDEDGNPVMVKVRDAGLKADLDEAKKHLDEAKKALADLKKSGTATEDEIKAAEQTVTSRSEVVSNTQAEFNKLSGQYSYMKAIESTQEAIDKNDETIKDNRTYYEVDANGDAVLDADGKVTATQKMKDEVTAYFDEKIKAAEKYLIDAAAYAGLTGAAKEDAEAKMATKIEGQDAEIYLNGVKYTNSSNTFEINGLTITAQKETSEEITLTTTEDTEGIYDMIKNFFKEYNKLINEMSSLYNAESSKGYEPLLSEEKAELADSEIEEWEKKIKDSLLRRDSTLRDVSDAMKTVLMQGATVNGKTMYLSDFGINTLGYFNAADNEKGAYHIDGDKDDSNVANNDDKLRQMIAANPETVKKFFTGLTENLHNTLADKMKSVANTSSAFTVYNDKLMQKEYDDYKDRIKTEETKLNDLMDKWYAKFSAMETAMAKLQSKNNAVAGMLGGG